MNLLDSVLSIAQRRVHYHDVFVGYTPCGVIFHFSHCTDIDNISGNSKGMGVGIKVNHKK